MPRKKKEKGDFNIKTFFITSIVTAIGLVVGLFWKDVITAAIDRYISQSDTLLAQTVTAVLLTLAAAIIIYLLYKSQKIATQYERVVKKTVKRHGKVIEKRAKKYSQILKGSTV